MTRTSNFLLLSVVALDSLGMSGTHANTSRPDPRIKLIIAKLKQQRRELDEILATLHEIDANLPATSPDAGSYHDHEKSLLVRALKRARGNQSEATRALGITRDKLRYRLSRHNLRSDEFSQD